MPNHSGSLQVGGDLQVDADPRPRAIPSGGGRHFHPQGDRVGSGASPSVGDVDEERAVGWPTLVSVVQEFGPAVTPSTLLTSRSRPLARQRSSDDGPGVPSPPVVSGRAELETSSLAAPVVIGRPAPQLQGRPAHRQTQELPELAGACVECCWSNGELGCRHGEFRAGRPRPHRRRCAQRLLRPGHHVPGRCPNGGRVELGLDGQPALRLSVAVKPAGRSNSASSPALTTGASSTTLPPAARPLRRRQRRPALRCWRCAAGCAATPRPRGQDRSPPAH